MKQAIIIGLLLLATDLGFAQMGGDLDSDFGSQGFSILDFEADTAENMYDLIPLDNGKSLLIGQIFYTLNTDILVARINANGSPDLSFGNGGYIVHDLGSYGDHATNGLVLSDGKIIIIGYSFSFADADGFILRLNEDGSIDESFGEGSKGYTYFNAGAKKTCKPYKIMGFGGSFFVLANTLNNGDMDYSVFKFTAAGIMDQSFGNNGSVVLSVYGNDIPLGMAISSEGKISVCGESWDNGIDYGVIFQLTSNGAVDKSFSTTGLKIIDFGKDANTVYDLAYTSNDQILAIGFEGNNPDINGFVFRLKKNGEFDSIFAGNGIIFSDIGTTTAVILTNINILDDESILASGYLYQNGKWQIYALMLTPNGKPHSNFGTGGDVNYDYPLEIDLVSLRECEVVDDGKILMAGNLILTNGNNTIYVVRMEGPQEEPTSSLEELSPLLIMCPNPTRHSFQIDVPEDHVFEVRLYDASGLEVQTWTETQHTYEISETISSGLYYVQVIVANRSYIEKLVILR